MDNTFTFYQHVSAVEKIFEDFRADPQASNNYYRRNIIYSSFYGLFRAEYYYNASMNITGSISNRTINALANLSSNQAYLGTNTLIIDNALLSFGNILRYIPNYNPPARIAVTDAIYNYTYLSEPYIWAVYTITNYNNCIYGYTTLSTLCMSSLRSGLINLALPRNYSFEDRSIRFQTKLPKNSTEKLYLAVKDVDQQFYRLTGSKYPVDLDPNKKINLVVYGSRRDYEIYQPFIYGLSTNNGGIYIEEWDTLFTYERTVQESIFTLEELLRHEYSHYLQGRYLVNGLFQTAPFYNGGRLTWFSEGGAEFLSGSSSDQGIRLRKSVVRYGQSRPIPTISQIVYSTYSTSSYIPYSYGGMLFQFLYEQRKDILFDLLSKVRSEDIAGYDNLVSSISQDQNLNSQFNSYASYQIANYNSLTTPNTIWTDDSLNINSISQIQSHLSSNPSFSNQNCYVSSEPDGSSGGGFGLSRFTCKSVMNGYLNSAWTRHSAYNYFDSQLNLFYAYAQTLNINNYRELNCRFDNIKIISTTGGQYPTANYYCEGPLGYSGSNFLTRSAQAVLNDITSISMTSNNFCNAVSSYPPIFNCNIRINSAFYTTQTAAQEDFDNRLDEFKTKLFALNPQYYRDFRTNKVGSPTVINNGGQVGIRQDVNIILNLDKN